jgi:hypothetical protein
LPGISEELSQAGLEVYEALATSEVFYLSEQYPGAIAVIDPSIDDEAAGEIERHQIGLRIGAEATAAAPANIRKVNCRKQAI